MTAPDIAVRSGYLLLDLGTARRQFYEDRANGGWNGAIGVHTTESPLDRIAPDTGAENVGTFIAGRSDAGSYVELVDTDSVVPLVPWYFTTFSVATSGYNSRTLSLALAARGSDLHPDDPATRRMIDVLGWRCVVNWRAGGFDPMAGRRWIGTGALAGVGPGLFNHGDVQPGDRSDAWARHPHRDAFSDLLLAAITRYASDAPAPTPYRRPARRARMIHTFTNVEGRAEQVMVDDDGHLRNAFDVPTPFGIDAVSDWGFPLGADLVLSDLGEFEAPGDDPHVLWAPAAAAPVYGYKAMTVIYDRGRWSVQQTNMLRQYLAELAKG